MPLPRDRFPAEIYLKQGAKRLPDIELPGGFWTVSAKLADILRQFELGRIALYRTLSACALIARRSIEGEYFCLSHRRAEGSTILARGVARLGATQPLAEPTKSTRRLARAIRRRRRHWPRARLRSAAQTCG